MEKAAPQPDVPTGKKPIAKNSSDEAASASSLASLPVESVLYLIRDQKVMLEHDVARLYEVETRTLVRAVRRNIEHFPVDFLFKLTPEEFEQLQAKTPSGSPSYERNRSTPYAFTEAGVAMVSQVLNSARALQVNVAIIRDFVKLRRLCGSNVEMSDKLDAMHARYDQQLKRILDVLEQMQSQLKPAPNRHIGFHVQ